MAVGGGGDNSVRRGVCCMTGPADYCVESRIKVGNTLNIGIYFDFIKGLLVQLLAHKTNDLLEI